MITAAKGGLLGLHNITRRFAAIVARAVPRIGLHDLRHVPACLDPASGMSIKAVTARLGHSDPCITLRTYAHVMPHEELAAAERLGAMLSLTKG